MENKNKSYMNTKLLEDHNHIYNKKEAKHPFLLQFKQLKYYYNLRKIFKNNFSQGYNSQEKNELNPFPAVSQNMYCLIDRKWLKKWKKYVGYKEIKNTIKKNKIERDLDNNDYQWISEIIDKNYKENYLYPLDNNTIYKENEINLLSDFKVIHKDCFQLFNIISNNSDINQNFRKYPIRLFKDKYILFLNNDMFFIVFKNINSHIFNEIIVDFMEITENNKKDNKKQNEKIKRRKKKIIDILINKDINEWLKEINFNFNEIKIELEYYSCKFKIYNKTLLRKFEEKKMNDCLNNNIKIENNNKNNQKQDAINEPKIHSSNSNNDNEKQINNNSEYSNKQINNFVKSKSAKFF